MSAGRSVASEDRTTSQISMPETLRVSSAVEQVEEQMIRKAMVQYDGNKKRVATSLGISRSYLYKRLAQMGLGV